ncbi:MAG TPA: hypothetical protein VFQ35_01050 [Polyangiaceae bacterium]|nr:hypothetical protein [Polyangiaceae bacterium]
MTELAPPGYASRERGDGPDLAFPVGVSAFAAATLLTSFYEVCVAAPRAFARLSQPNWSLSIALGAIALGAWLTRRSRALGADTGFALLACFSAGSAHALALGFAHGPFLDIFEVAVPLYGGLLFGATGLALARDVGRELAALEAVPYLMNPLRLAALSAGWLGVLLTFPALGILRRGALVAALLTGAALLLPFVERLFGKTRRKEPRSLQALATFATVASLGVAHHSVPLSVVQSHPGDVVYALETGRGEHVIARSQGGLLLFSNDVLALTTNDSTRFAEALVHPALSLAARRARVLAIDDGTGPVAREALRWKDLESLTLVPHDPALAQLAREGDWFSALTSEALNDRRVTWVDREAAPFVLESKELFDVVLLNASDPSDYRSGKYFSRYWLEAVRMHLGADGVLAVQTTSPLRTPRAFASILETLNRAGFSVVSYRAALPTLGEWSFALAFTTSEPIASRLAHVHSIPTGTEYVSDRMLPTLLASSPEPPPHDTAPVNHLWDQPVVELYRREDRSLTE